MRKLQVLITLTLVGGFIFTLFSLMSLPGDSSRSSVRVRLATNTARTGAGTVPVEEDSSETSVKRSGKNTDQITSQFARALTPSETVGLDWLAKAQKTFAVNKHILADEIPQSVTLVSALLDLGRDKLGGGFSRGFQEYINRFRGFMNYNLPKVIFIDEAHYDEVKPLIDSSPSPVKVLFRSREFLEQLPYYSKIQKVRTKPGWASQAGWLMDSPQAKLPHYNPLVMSKLFWLREVARENPFNTDAFLFIDGGHLCNDPNGMTKEKFNEFMAPKLLKKLLITFFDYTPVNEIHGFSTQPFQEFIGSRKIPLMVGRGGIFGGTPGYIEVAAQVYEVILHATLDSEHMGTEENLFSILDYRFPELVHHFDNKEGGNCAVFQYVAHPPIDPEVDGYDLRGLTCERGWENKQGQTVCYDNGQPCPPEITPFSLTEAKTQYLCQQTGQYYCTVTCKGNEVHWYANPCKPEDANSKHCAPYPRTPASALREEADEQKDTQKPQLEPKSEKNEGVHPGSRGRHAPTSELSKQQLSEEQRQTLQKYGYDLRGARCELHPDDATREVCFIDDASGREMCPPYVTPAYLALAKGQGLCQPTSPGYYCTVTCQDGNNVIRWHAHEEKWCNENPGSCPPKPETVPYDEYFTPAWAGKPRRARACRDKTPTGQKFKMTVGFLVYKSMRSFDEALVSHEKSGFLEMVDEVLIYANARTPEIDAALEKYTRAPYNVKVMGDSNNHGIARALNWLVGNASNEVFLFMEKDFHSIEPLACFEEQLDSGIKLLQSGDAHVIRYRSRWESGRPNWADILFRGHEDDVFGRQPNLLCNFYHWIEEPDKRWPKHFWICDKDPVMYCSDSEFCNWTNNPSMILKSWWMNEYVARFPHFTRLDPYYDLEMYMNWEPDSWNTRGWTVAQGDGMFKHADRNNF